MDFVTSNVASVIRKIADMPKQVNFATSMAINQTARDVQQSTVNGFLQSNFTLRSSGTPWFKPGNKLGFRADFSTKQNLQAKVGTMADWFLWQEEGGTKKASGHRIAIPSTFWKKREELMARQKKPGALLREFKSNEKRKKTLQTILQKESATGLRHSANGKILKKDGKELRSTYRSRRALKGEFNAKKKQAQLIGSLAFRPFKARMKTGVEGIFVRTSTKRGPVKILFRFLDTTKIDKPIHWKAFAQKIVSHKFEKNFDKAFRSALLTAK